MWRRIFSDKLTVIATLFLVLVFAMIIFNFQSGFPVQHPLFGILDFLLIVAFAIAAGVIFIVAFVRTAK